MSIRCKAHVDLLVFFSLSLCHMYNIFVDSSTLFFFLIRASDPVRVWSTENRQTDRKQRRQPPSTMKAFTVFVACTLLIGYVASQEHSSEENVPKKEHHVYTFEAPAEQVQVPDRGARRLAFSSLYILAHT